MDGEGDSFIIVFGGDGIVFGVVVVFVNIGIFLGIIFWGIVNVFFVVLGIFI